jgi:hypothetical protein
MTDQDRANLIRQQSFTRQVLIPHRNVIEVTRYVYDPDTDTHIKHKPILRPVEAPNHSEIK